MQQLLLTLASKVLEHIDDGRTSRRLFMTGALGHGGIAAGKSWTDSCSACCRCRRHASGPGSAQRAQTRTSQHSEGLCFGVVVGGFNYHTPTTCSSPTSNRAKAQQSALQKVSESTSMPGRVVAGLGSTADVRLARSCLSYLNQFSEKSNQIFIYPSSTDSCTCASGEHVSSFSISHSNEW